MPTHRIRTATTADAGAIGRLLHDFNTEFGAPTPDPDTMAARVRDLLAGDHISVLLGGDGPRGLALLRFRPALWSTASEAYLAELYVIPSERGRGLGRALLEAAMEFARARGADYMGLNTGDTDLAARSLYESAGFTNREAGGAILYHYEREL